MRLGVHLVDLAFAGGTPGLGPAFATLGRTCDEAGVDVLSLPDHFLTPGYLGSVDDPVLEGYTALAFLAACTSRVELQLLETCVTYRHPGVLAKTVATLDVLSGGRARLGLGAGWFRREHAALGVPFPPLRERLELLEEAVAVVRQMWSADDGPFEGRHYRLAETRCSPRPLRPPLVMVPGTDERKTLRLVARVADACNVFAGGELAEEWVGAKLDALRRHCATEGTDFDALRRTVLWTDPVADGAALVERMRPLADLGVDEVHLQTGGAGALTAIRGLADGVPALHAL